MSKVNMSIQQIKTQSKQIQAYSKILKIKISKSQRQLDYKKNFCQAEKTTRS
jgi:hypothetical protein